MHRDRYPLLLVAISGRSLAEAAARTGLTSVVLDCFADRDTRQAAARWRAVPSKGSFRLDGRALLSAAESLAPPAQSAGLVYGSGFEGRPRLLARLARGRVLLGNQPAVLTGLRDPQRFFPMLDAVGIRYPEVRFSPPAEPEGWLVKHAGGSGGTGVRWYGGRAAGRGAYYQRQLDGMVCSALFLGNGKRAWLAGLNRQWTGPSQSTRPFLYGGAVSHPRLSPGLVDDLSMRLDALVERTGLLGLNGLDFIVRPEGWWALEVNPRPTATLELHDPDYAGGLLAAHLAMFRGEEPALDRRPGPARANLIVTAPMAWQVEPDFSFPAWASDLPPVGTALQPGDPICTVRAEGVADQDAESLVRRRRDELIDLVRRQAGAGV